MLASPPLTLCSPPPSPPYSSDMFPSPSQTNLNSSGASNGKWPLRPGVLVHVNTNHSLLSHQSPPSSPNKSASSDGLDKRKKRSFLNATFSAEPVSQPSRTAKIKSMFSGGKFSHSDSNGTLPGVFNKSGGKNQELHIG